jgi:hypothetical protein
MYKGFVFEHGCVCPCASSFVRRDAFDAIPAQIAAFLAFACGHCDGLRYMGRRRAAWGGRERRGVYNRWLHNALVERQATGIQDLAERFLRDQESYLWIAPPDPDFSYFSPARRLPSST